MKPVYQTIFGKPHGNCLQACVASLFELELDQVPNFMTFKSDWWDQLVEFCKPRGVYPLHVRFPEVEDTCQNLHGIYFAAVETQRGLLHETIWKDGVMIHDPYPGGSVITRVEGYTVFVSLMEGANAPLLEG